MVAKVTKEGVVIPSRWLKGVTHVEIRRGRGRITLIPTRKPDPLRKLGRKPVDCLAPDASANHDRYLYRQRA